MADFIKQAVQEMLEVLFKGDREAMNRAIEEAIKGDKEAIGGLSYENIMKYMEEEKSNE